MRVAFGWLIGVGLHVDATAVRDGCWCRSSGRSDLEHAAVAGSVQQRRSQLGDGGC